MICKQIKIGFAQFKPMLNNRDYNFSFIENTIKKNEFDLLVFPELSTSGYAFNSIKELNNSAISIKHTFLKHLKYLCKKRDCAIVLGFAEISNNNFFNSSVLINEKGDITLYRKLHLFYEEKKYFNKGNLKLKLAKVKNARIGQMICFDWIFPEVVRSLAIMGADIIAHPANLVMPYCQNAMKTRSLENRIFSITANRIGKERQYKFTGKSQITDIYGNVILKANSKSQIVKFVNIDYKKARDKNINIYNHLIKDRRRNKYVL